MSSYAATKPINTSGSGINPAQFTPVSNFLNSNTPPNTQQIQTPPINTQMNNLQNPMKPVPAAQVNLTTMQNQINQLPMNQMNKPTTQIPVSSVKNSPQNPQTLINQTAGLGNASTGLSNNPNSFPLGKPSNAKSENEWQGFDIFNDNFAAQPSKNVQPPASKQLDIFDLEYLGSAAAPKSDSTFNESKENPLGVLALPVDHSPKKPSTEISNPPPAVTINEQKEDELVDQLVKMGFGAKESKMALLDTNNNLERAVELLCNPPSQRKPSFEYPSEDVARLQAMGFKPEQSKIALTEANGDVEKAIDILVHQKFTRKVSFSEVPSKGETKVDAAKIVDTASSIGKSMFNSAKSVLAFSKKKVEEVLDTIAKEKDERGYSDRTEDELEWARSKYKDQVVSKSPEQYEPIQKTSKQSPVRMPGFEDEDEVDIPLEKKRTSSTQRSPSNTLLETGALNKSESIKPNSPQTQNLKPIKEDILASQAQIDLSNTHKNLGNELFKKGQFGDAEQKYSDAIKDLPEGHSLTFILFNNRAAARLKTGDYKGAISDCDLVFNRDPQDVKCLLRRANAWEALEQWEKAKDDYKKILAIDPNTKGVSLAIARCTSASQPKEPAAVAPKETTPVSKPVVISAAVKTAVDQAVQNLRAANEANEQEESQKFALLDTIDLWKKNKEKNLRALISSLEAILWPGCNWKPVNLGELITPQQVKVKYMKAVAKVHPDKLSPNCTVEEKLIANSVFSILNKAWDEFKIANNI
ncbi:hypothetical protein HDV04_003216 [Boothiomyces sp. JEL0838]|nr:hypothetical protein HDV04_003216 [Boothiomyces sp. JEL0838]